MTYTITYTVAPSYPNPASQKTIHASSLVEATWEIAFAFRADRPCRVMRQGWYKPIVFGEGYALVDENALKRRDQQELVAAVRAALEELRREEYEAKLDEYERVQYARRMAGELA